MNDIAVTPADVWSHAADVDVLGDEASIARRQADPIGLDRSAYGQLCQTLPDLLNPIASMVTAAIGQAVSAMHDTATRLRLAAAGYREVDGGVSQRFIDVAGPP